MKKMIASLTAISCAIFGNYCFARAFDAQYHQSMLEAYETEQRMYNFTPNVDRNDGYNRWLDAQKQNEQRALNWELIKERQKNKYYRSHNYNSRPDNLK